MEEQLEIIGHKNGKKKKKLHGFSKFLVIFLCVLLGLVVLLVVLAFALLYDGTTKDLKVRQNYSNEQVLNEVIVDSLDNATTDKNVNIKVTENQLNQLLYNVNNGQTLIPGTNTKLYIEIKDKTYTFYTEIQVSFLKARLILATELNNTDDAFVFKMTSIKASRLNVDFLLNMIPDDFTKSIETSLANAGLEMKMDLKNRTITYTHEAFMKTVKKATGGNDFFTVIQDLLLNKNVTSLTTDNAISAKINLEYLATNPTYFPDSDTAYYFQDAAVKNYTIKSLVDKGLVKPTDINVMTKYFLRGYDYLSTGEATILDGYYTVLKNEGIVDSDIKDYKIEKYGSVYTKKTVDFNSIIQTGIAGGFGTAEIKESDMKDAFTNISAIGTVYTLARNISEDETKLDYKINYVCIDDIKAEITATHFTVILDLNFNGYHTQMGIVTKAKAGTEYNKMTLLLSDSLDTELGLYFGKNRCGTDLCNYIYKMFDNLGDSFNNMFTFKKTVEGQYYFEMDVTSAVSPLNTTIALAQDKVTVTPIIP